MRLVDEWEWPSLKKALARRVALEARTGLLSVAGPPIPSSQSKAISGAYSAKETSQNKQSALHITKNLNSILGSNKLNKMERMRVIVSRAMK
jgi:hypothetical protein